MNKRTTLILCLTLLFTDSGRADAVAFSGSSDIYGEDEVLYKTVLETGQATPRALIDDRSIDGGYARPAERIFGIDENYSEFWQMLLAGQLKRGSSVHTSGDGTILGTAGATISSLWKPSEWSPPVSFTATTFGATAAERGGSV